MYISILYLMLCVWVALLPIVLYRAQKVGHTANGYLIHHDPRFKVDIRRAERSPLKLKT